MRAKLVSAADAVEIITDGATVTVSSSSGLGCPDLLLRALGERFASGGSPKGLTLLHPIAAGDLYGIGGIEHLAQEGLIDTVIAGSYPSGPSSLPMPKIWQMIINNQIAAYNVPSGIMFDMHRDVAAFRPGVLTQVGLDTFVDPRHGGCAMNAKAADKPIVSLKEFDEDSWLHFANIVPEFAIIRATTADERGNLAYEHEGAYLGALDQAIAVRNRGSKVIAQVKRVVDAGSIPAKQVHVPCHLVDYIAVDPAQKQTTQTDYDPAISGEIVRKWSEFSPIEHSIEKIIARRAALELRTGYAANLGFGISANIPFILLEEGCAQAVTWVIEQGAVGGLPMTGFAFGCASNPDGIVASPDQFTYFQGGGFDISFLSFLEIDQTGNVNASKLAKRPYLTAGCGGFVDIVARAKKIVFAGMFEAGAKHKVDGNGIEIVAAGKAQKIVEQVEQITFAAARAKQLNQQITYITERCVIQLTDQGLVATELMPGIDPQRDIVEASSGRVQITKDAIPMDKRILLTTPMGLEL